ncbi:MAG: hypothetical protein KJ950_05655 [Proteobacteria bacterium]|nr:hypothetical protein [Pseudomonadota bacterium]MBU1687398.1 hypothetical protein [Pseudomonadota bacterium]
MLLINKRTILTGLAILTIGLTGCGNNQTDPQTGNKAPVDAAPVKTEPAAKVAYQGSPPPNLPPEQILTITAKVLEVLDGGSFTFLKIDWDGKQPWAAVPASEVKKGQEVTLLNAAVIPNFQSSALHRSFDEIIFASGIEGVNPRNRQAKGGPPRDIMERRSMQLVAAARSFDEKEAQSSFSTAPAPEYTITEIYRRQAELKDTPVRIKGKIIKTTPGAMGKNWLHIEDGSGTSEQQDNDLTVNTLEDLPEKGTAVIVQGMLRTERDFGGGYSYTAIVEDAHLSLDR